MDKLTWYDNDGRIMCRRGYEVALARLASYEAAGLTPEQVVNAKTIIEAAFADDTSKAERIRKLVAADDEGRVTILPCRGDADIVLTRNGIAFKARPLEHSSDRVCRKSADTERKEGCPVRS